MGEKLNREQVAREAAHLLNEAIRELLIPQHLAELAERGYEGGHLTERYGAALKHLALMSAVMNVCRLKETRDYFLERWLFSDDGLRGAGFPPVEEFVGDWKSFLIVRNQYAGHVASQKATKTRPGRILSAAALGNALRKTGLWDSEHFLRRVRKELVPGVEKVRNELLRNYPGARRFFELTYPAELKASAEKEKS